MENRPHFGVWNPNSNNPLCFLFIIGSASGEKFIKVRFGSDDMCFGWNVNRFLIVTTLHLSFVSPHGPDTKTWLCLTPWVSLSHHHILDRAQTDADTDWGDCCWTLNTWLHIWKMCGEGGDNKNQILMTESASLDILIVLASYTDIAEVSIHV